jgi:alkylhydroperoxidase family enzyme
LLNDPELVRAVTTDYRTAPLSDAEKALFVFVDKVNGASATMTQDDVETAKRAGWTEEALYDAITVCALFNFYNRWIDASGVQDLPAGVYPMLGQRLAQLGYTSFGSGA